MARRFLAWRCNDDKDQSARFIQTAIERDADRLSSPADKLLGRLAKMKPEPRTKKGGRNG
jgi:hypothetical protein